MSSEKHLCDVIYFLFNMLFNIIIVSVVYYNGFPFVVMKLYLHSSAVCSQE